MLIFVCAPCYRTSGMRRVVIVDGTRTPFVKAGTLYAELDVLDLAKVATTEALARCEVSPSDVDEVNYGNVSRPVVYHNLAREIVLALAMPPRIPAFTVGMACASACVAITNAVDHIAGGSAAWRGRSSDPRRTSRLREPAPARVVGGTELGQPHVLNNLGN
jgi:hypothetical protein